MTITENLEEVKQMLFRYNGKPGVLPMIMRKMYLIGSQCNEEIPELDRLISPLARARARLEKAYSNGYVVGSDVETVMNALNEASEMAKLN